MLFKQKVFSASVLRKHPDDVMYQKEVIWVFLIQ